MEHESNAASKAEVQSTELNKMPVTNAQDEEYAEELAGQGQPSNQPQPQANNSAFAE